MPFDDQETRVSLVHLLSQVKKCLAKESEMPALPGTHLPGRLRCHRASKAGTSIGEGPARLRPTILEKQHLTRQAPLARKALQLRNSLCLPPGRLGSRSVIPL